ncbi:MAG: S26 family signal peptidase [Pseudomonadota bacterium]
MRKAPAIVASGVILISLIGFVFDPQDRLIWNRTGSAPEGFYWLSDAPFTPGRWGVISARSGAAEWAVARGFVGRDWPLIKRIAAMPGDEICRHGELVSVNGKDVAVALSVDHLGRELPVWRGCFVLKDTEVFLLNPHPRSLDGRYFGPTKREDLDGVGVLLWTTD